MPALLAVKAGKVKTLSEIYEKKLNPEAVPLCSLPVATSAVVKFETSFLAAMSSSRQRLSFGEKLLAKCSSLNKQEGVRYIRPQVLKALKSKEPLDVDIATSFLMSMLLGTMEGAPMANPDLRIRVHTQFDAEVTRALQALSSRALWLGLIYWVNAAANSNPVLRRLRAPGGCATSIDKLMKEQLKTVVTHVLPAVQGQPGVRIPSFTSKRKAPKRQREQWPQRAAKKRRLRPEVILRVTGESDLHTAKIKMSEGYRTIMREAPYTPWASCTPVLDRIGWNSPDGRLVYEHATTQRREFSLLPTHGLLAEAQRRAAPNGAYVAVCLECFTLRTRARGQDANKATEGTIIMRHPTGTERCANCYSDRIEHLDLNGLMITSLTRAIEQRASMCTVCTGCGFPAAIHTMHGINVFCKACSKQQELTDCFDRHCACCRRVLSKRGHYKAIVVEGSPPEIKLVCHACQDAEAADHIWTRTMLKRNKKAAQKRSWITS